MAIRMMVAPNTPGAERTKYMDTEVWMETTHVGHVLELREYNMRDDSDFYAVVWDDEKGAPAKVTYATTRAWTYPNGAAVDATAEVRAKYDAWLAKIEAARAAAAERRIAMTPAKGKRVKVVKGRKVKVGTEGEVFWYGPDKFGPGYRVGIETADGNKVFTAANNVAVIEAVAA